VFILMFECRVEKAKVTGSLAGTTWVENNGASRWQVERGYTTFLCQRTVSGLIKFCGFNVEGIRFCPDC
jgi:hypothetical protein